MSAGVFQAGSAVGKMGMDASGFVSGMLQAQSIAQLFPQTVTNFIANPLLGVIGLLKDVGSAIADLIGGFANMADDMGALAESVGVNVQWLTSLGKVAELSRGSIDGVAEAVKFLGKNMAESATSADIAATFDRIGVAVRDAAGSMRPLEEVFMEVGEAIKALPSGAERTQVAMDLLGRSGTTMIATFMQGRQEIQRLMATADEFGASITDAEAQAGGAFNKLLGQIKWAWEGIKQELALPLMESLTPVFEELLGWIRANQPTIKAFVRDVADMLVNIAKIIAGLLPTLNTLLQGIQNIGSFMKYATPVGWAYQAISAVASGPNVASAPSQQPSYGGGGGMPQPAQINVYNRVDGAVTESDVRRTARKTEDSLRDALRRLESQQMARDAAYRM